MDWIPLGRKGLHSWSRILYSGTSCPLPRNCPFVRGKRASVVISGATRDHSVEGTSFAYVCYRVRVGTEVGEVGR